MARRRKKAKTGTRSRARASRARARRARSTGLRNSAITRAVKSNRKSAKASTPSSLTNLIKTLSNLKSKAHEPEGRPVKNSSGNTGLSNSAIMNLIKTLSNLKSKAHEPEGRPRRPK